MEKKYISENRYKKNSDLKRQSYRKNINVKDKLKEQKKEVVSKNDNVKIQKNQAKMKNKKQVRASGNKTKVVNILICILLLIVTSLLSRAILKEENEPFIPKFSSKMEENNDEIKVSVITKDDLKSKSTSNIVAMELDTYAHDMLIKVDREYNIQYKILSSVEKVSNKEYDININKAYEITATSLKEVLESYMQKDSKYYLKTANIKEIKILDEYKIKIVLKKEDAYYIYNLDLPINKSKNSEYNIKMNDASHIEFTRKEETSKILPYKIQLSSYADLYKVIEVYKKGEIDAFVTSQQSFRNILGKYEYNIKEYRNGETLFLLGSNKSNLFARKEVRQAIAYSIDRGNIIKEIIQGAATKIDLPYIYDEVKYKYDIYAADNILLSNGYVKSKGIYRKKENGKNITLNLELIVNQADDIKVQVAEEIKKNLNTIGIGVSINKLSERNIASKVSSGDYDILLASISLNNNPSIDFIKNHINITREISKQLEKLEASSLEDIQKNIDDLRTMLSNEIACIGIYANSTYMILNKNILGFEEISYMNIFEKVLNINK